MDEYVSMLPLSSTSAFCLCHPQHEAGDRTSILHCKIQLWNKALWTFFLEYNAKM